LTPQQVHLKETVLGVQESEGSRGVNPAAGADRRNTKFVSLDVHSIGETDECLGAIELRQAPVHARPQPDPPGSGGQDQQPDQQSERERQASQNTPRAARDVDICGSR
jgi:hypothetical protein